MKKVYLITGTDTDVGKTVAALALGLLMQNKGKDVGVLKPVQCAGDDAAFLKRGLDLEDPLEEINPCYAKDPLSPNVAFSRQKEKFSLTKVRSAFETLKARHEILLVEGAGGFLVPLAKDYLIADLARDLDIHMQVIIVARPGLGTINHTLLTLKQIQQYGLDVAGIVFSDVSGKNKGISEKTNPEVIKQFARVPILGTIPYLKTFQSKEILLRCSNAVNVQPLIRKAKDRAGEWEQDDKQYVWHPFTQMQDWQREHPLVIERSQGCYLYDAKGNRYLDGVSSLWVNVHGHAKKEIDEAIINQVRKLDHSTLLGLANAPSVELAKQLVKITPEGLDKVFYSDSGSTSAEIAVKIAYQYWQNIGKTKKCKIMHMENSYHGDTLGSVSVGGIDLFHKVYKDLIFETLQLDFCDGYRAPAGKVYPDYAFECLDRFEETLKKNHDTIAALIVEPIVQGAAGMIMWPSGVLTRMAHLCKQYDVLLIADEVATGFGRTGKMFAVEHENVRPDIMCLAKGITAGYLPLAATLTTQEIYNSFLADYKEQKTFFHGHTYTGNPICCAAALANLEVFRKEKTIEKIQPKIRYLSQELKRFEAIDAVGDIRQRGMMIGIELVKDRTTKEPFPWEQQMGVQVCGKVRERGLILRPLGNVIVMMPPLAITKAQIKEMLDVTYWAIQEVIKNPGTC